jgi:O-acetyl-ADP-ribose deacetylase (regulator of RNase III)
MTRWSVRHADLLDIVADGLLCSANPSLNLSGGIGGAILLKYGDAMQTFLHEQLRAQGVRTVPPGTVVLSPPFGLPHRDVAHAVAIDVFYETNADLIWSTYQTAFAQLSAAGCRSIAASCLGCGYGRFPPADFAAVARRLFATDIPNVDQVTLATTNRELAEALEAVLLANLRERSRKGPNSRSDPSY